MLQYALIYIAAFIYICERNEVKAIKFKSLSPFGGHLLQKVSDFNDVVEPDSDQRSASNLLKTRQSKAAEKESSKYPHCSGNTPNSGRKRGLDYKIKRELEQLGTVFISEFLDDDKDSQKRLQRPSETAVEELLWEDEDEEPENSKSHVNSEDPFGEESKFRAQQINAANITKASKILYDYIKRPPGLDDDEFDELGLEGDLPKKNKPKSNEFGSLKMNFYKPSTSIGRAKTSSNDDKPLLINLYPDKDKSSIIQTPEKYDYIGLLSNGNSLMGVPAVKLAVITEGNDKRNCENFEPFYISKYSKKPHPKFQATSDLRRIIDYKGQNTQWTHVPVLFVNTIPHLEAKKKRANYGVSDNSFLRDVDLLIQKVKTSLKMGFDDKKAGAPADAAILINSKIRNQNSGRPAMRNYFRKHFKQKVREESPFIDNLDDESVGSIYRTKLLNKDFSSSFVEDNLLKKDSLAPSISFDLPLNKDETLSNKFKNVPTNKLNSMKNTDSHSGKAYNQDDNLVKNEVGSILGDPLIKSGLNSLKDVPSKTYI